MALREYQAQAVQRGLDLLRSDSLQNGVIVIPTGGGKSHVGAAIADEADGETLILQPNKEILEQNFQKLTDIGRRDLAIYSASLGSKGIDHITLATIGSIYKKPELFQRFQQVLVDECDLVNAKQGMYKSFFEAIGKPVLGFTASPWRLSPGKKIGKKRLPNGRSIDVFSGSVNRIITRTRPRVFHDLIHITQIGDLYAQGYLCPLKYREGVFDERQLTLNSTGNDYTDASYRKISHNTVIDACSAAESVNANHTLIFTKNVDEAEQINEKLNARGFSCAIVTAETKKDNRERILNQFKSGVIRAVVNVGVLTVGFDFPALDHVILARPINSARLLYQIIGRGIRPHVSKAFCTISDLCGNINRLGRIENWIIGDNDGDKKYRLKCGSSFLTGVDMKTRIDLEDKPNVQKNVRDLSIIHFGKFKGQHMSEVPIDYLEWIVGNFAAGDFKDQAIDEVARRTKESAA